jgi:YesN/AraC family two-component response regulator
MTVVCVDDHPIMLQSLAQNIRLILPNANIHSFKHAEDALSFVNENGCEILISEIELCGTNGLMLAKHVKNINPKVNIIFLTVCDEREHAREVLKIKPSGYLVKPAKKEQLEFELKNLRYCAY